MSLATPESIRKLQRKLYLKAKDEPAFRFYLLHDKICREDILRHAYDLARANKGAPGVDGATFAMIEASGREEWLAAIRKDLVAKTYRALPVRRVMIPKPGGGFAAEVELVLTNTQGEPLTRAEVRTVFKRPAQDGADFELVLNSKRPGIYRAGFKLPMIGLWDIHVTIRRDGDLFVHDERVMLRSCRGVGGKC